MGAELAGVAAVAAVALFALGRAPLPTLMAIAVAGGLMDHGVLPSVDLGAGRSVSALQATATARAVCERRAMAALLGDAELTDESVAALERDCAPPAANPAP